MSDLKENIVRDESQFAGNAISIFSPYSTEEVSHIIKECRKEKTSLTVHGGLTGINGAGVPVGGHSMDMRNMARCIYDEATQTVWAEAGCDFLTIETTARKDSHMTREFPASPTEKGATIGGAVSFGSSGLRSYKYGNVANFVTEIEYCDAQGDIRLVKKGEEAFTQLLGSEGMYAIITGVRLETTPIPEALWGLLFFFPDEAAAMQFCDLAQDEPHISVFEYCDTQSLALIEEHRATLSTLAKVPELPNTDSPVVYLELEADTEDEMEESAEQLIEWTMEAGGDPDTIWTAVGNETEVLRLMRHAISECINLKISLIHQSEPEVLKLSSGVCFSQKSCTELLAYYREALESESLTGVIFGHIGNKMPYVNILANNADEFARAKELICEWWKAADTPRQECGVGKVYRDCFAKAAPDEVLNVKAEKNVWDEGLLFNPANLPE